MSGNVLGHVVLMLVGVLILVFGAFVGSTDKGEEKLNLHRGLGVIGILVFLLGVVALLLTGNVHANLPHFFLGLIAVIFFILAAIGGIAYTKADKTKKEGLRKSHKAVAAIGFLFVLVAIVFGIIGIKALK
ncbi:hypothetical protein [Caldisericum exile]|uniref:hypothetical protein n=1 Tax=Caldisericum exile TaxID=693075 RepID=UPI003C7339F4